MIEFDRSIPAVGVSSPPRPAPPGADRGGGGRDGADWNAALGNAGAAASTAAPERVDGGTSIARNDYGPRTDDAKVRGIIDAVISRVLPYQTKYPPPGAVGQAWTLLRDYRQKKAEPVDLDLPRDRNDVNLTAAEHYLFSRYRVGAGHVSPEQAKAEAVTYGQIKRGLQLVPGLSNILRQGDQAPSPASSDVVRWGLKGVDAGVEDKRFHDLLP